MAEKRKTIGLALGSGGPRGLTHIGVIQALSENNIPIDYIAGTSIGALIGTHFALYRNMDKLVSDIVGYKKEKLKVLLEPTLSGGLFRGRKIENILRGWFGKKNFSDLTLPLQIVATDLVEAKSVIFWEGSLVTAIRASMAVPGLFKPVEWEDKILVDGGLVNPVPDDVVRAMGADIVISVNLDNDKNNVFTKNDLSLSKVMRRSLEVIRQYLSQYSLKNSDFIIEPPLRELGGLNIPKFFLKEISDQAIAIGKQEALKIVPQIKKALNP
jgi:NTE family protein